MLLTSLGYIGLFIGTFISATIFPTPSEAFVIGAYELNYNIYIVLLVSTAGNLLGGLTNYYIGKKANSEKLKKKFNLNQERIDRWELKLKKYGYWLGLISWLPLIGDPLVGIMGFFKVKLWPLTITMLIGKLGRYIVLTLIYFHYV